MRVFLYGELRDTTQPAAVVRGELRRRGKDAAARFSPKGHYLVHGNLHDYTDKQLKKLDKYEAPEYVRLQVTTEAGEKVWAYEDVEDGFHSEPLIASGNYKNPDKIKKDDMP